MEVLVIEKYLLNFMKSITKIYAIFFFNKRSLSSISKEVNFSGYLFMIAECQFFANAIERLTIVAKCRVESIIRLGIK